MLGCQVLFSEDIATRVQRFVEGALGGECPCKVGKACPMLPAAEQVPAEVDAA